MEHSSPVESNNQLVEPARLSRPKRFLSIEDLTRLPKPEWLIQGMFEKNSLVMVAGPPGSLKSFLVLDWLLCIASGRDWHGKKVAKSNVLYVLGEGRSSLLKRINAWAFHWKPNPEEFQVVKDNFMISFEVPQLGMPSSMINFLSDVSRENFQPQVLVIDTFARSFVGLDENSARDAGLWIQEAENLRNRGYTVIFLHHTKKNFEFGLQFRGSTAIMGAIDTAFTVTKAPKKGNLITVTTTKQKDHPEGAPLYFRPLSVKTPFIGDDLANSAVMVPGIPDESFGYEIEDKLIREVLDNPYIEGLRSRGHELAKLLQQTLGEPVTDDTAIGRLRRYVKKEKARLAKLSETITPIE